MSASDVVAKYGTTALVRLLLAVALYLLLRALRWPVLLAVRLLDVALRRVDLYLAAGPALADTGPHAQEGSTDAPRH